MSCGFVRIEDPLCRHLGACGVGAVCRGELNVPEFGGGLVRIGKSRISQRGIRPSLESVISVEERLSVTDQMKMKQHGFHGTCGISQTTCRRKRHKKTRSLATVTAARLSLYVLKLYVLTVW